MRIQAILLLSALAHAQSDLPREVLDLAHIKTKMRESLDRAPHYTCLETVERSHRANEKSAFKLVDTLRLEVTTIGHQEFYSWPDGRRFEAGVADILHSGTISTGEYTGHASNVFTNSATQIQFVGHESFRGRAALKYDYRLASFASAWTLNFAGTSGIVGAYGSFWADAGTLDLLRLDSHADQIPPILAITAASSQIDYSIMHIGEGAVILPQSARLLVHVPAGEDRNLVEFSQCRPYTTQSAIHFGEAPPAVETAQPIAAQELTLAPNIAIALELTQPIDSKTSFEGDVIRARVAADVRVQHRVLIPKGAAVRGRIRRLERYSDPVPHFVVGLEFIEIESASQRWIFQGRLDRIDPIPGISWVLSTKHGETSLTSLTSGRNRLDFGSQALRGETLYTADLPGVGTFFMEGAQFRLAAGLHMLWRTVNQR